MNGLRVVLVTPRFWPLVGDTEDAMGDLACGLPRLGAETTVVSARWQTDWPAFSHFGKTQVHRLHRCGGGRGSRAYYLLSLARWLRRRRDQFDLAVVAGMRFEAYTTLWSLRRTRIPVVLRPEVEDVAWHQKSLAAASCRRRCRSAAALIARDPAIAQALRNADWPAPQIHPIPDGIPPGRLRKGTGCCEARRDLANANGDLTMGVGAPLVVYCGPLQRRAGLIPLVRAWPGVLRQWPAAKLWLIGEGPDREPLFQLIRDLEIADCVLLPGSFENLDQIFLAADLLVDPRAAGSLPRVFLQAAAAGLPIVAQLNAPWQAHPVLASLIQAVPEDADGQIWGRMIREALCQVPDRRQQAAQRRRLLSCHSLNRMLRAHLELFETLTCTPDGCLRHP